MENKIKSKIEFLEVFRELNAEMPIQMAVVFLNVISHEGITMTELYQKSGISQASVSRNIAALSKWHRKDRPGLDLVLTKEDPAERRRKQVFLTHKGKRLAERLKSI